jgi:hypothetical protein
MLGALSFTKKAAPMSSTDHGGGKRRGVIASDNRVLRVARDSTRDAARWHCCCQT